MLTEVRTLARRRKPPTQPTRLDAEAMRLAKIAAAYKNLSLLDYLALVVTEAARRDIEALSRETLQGKDQPKDEPAK